MEIISRSYDGIDVFFDNSDSLYINATQIAKQFFTSKGNPKDVSEWLNSKATKEYISEFKKYFVTEKIGNGDLVVIRQGGNSQEQGTWIHKKLIVLFARWLSPKFAVWCDLQIEEILAQNQPFKSEIPDLEYLKKRTELIKLSKDQFLDFEEVFYKIGIKREEELIVTSNRAVQKETGIDFIQLAELKGISTPEKYFTVTELCQKVMDSDKFSDEVKKLVSTKAGDKPRPQNLNKILESNGFQEKIDGIWKPTEKARNFSDFVQNKSKHSEKTVFHTVWKMEILEKIL